MAHSEFVFKEYYLSRPLDYNCTGQPFDNLCGNGAQGKTQNATTYGSHAGILPTLSKHIHKIIILSLLSTINCFVRLTVHVKG